MSQTKATFERVREACLQLLALDRPLSLANVLEITGGSKTTVQKHLRQLRSEMSAAGTIQGGDLVFLQRLADQIMPKLWEAAQAHARHSLERRIQDLTAVILGLQEDNQALSESEELALKRAEDAEVRAEALRLELQARTGLEAQIRALTGMVEMMGTSREAPDNAQMLVQEVLAEEKRPMERAELYRRLEESGLTPAAAHKAGFNAVARGAALDDGRLVSLPEIEPAKTAAGSVASQPALRRGRKFAGLGSMTSGEHQE